MGKGCFIGIKATILPGVHIGEGAVIGSCALITKDIPAWTIAGMWIFNHRQGILYNNGLVSAVGVTIIVLIMFAGIQYVGTDNIEYDM